MMAIFPIAISSLCHSALIPVHGLFCQLLSVAALAFYVWAMMLCPVVMAITAFRLHNRSTAVRFAMFACDILLSSLQVWLMRPIVQ
jgi:hypothetical protein